MFTALFGIATILSGSYTVKQINELVKEKNHLVETGRTLDGKYRLDGVEINVTADNKNLADPVFCFDERPVVLSQYKVFEFLQVVDKVAVLTDSGFHNVLRHSIQRYSVQPDQNSDVHHNIPSKDAEITLPDGNKEYVQLFRHTEIIKPYVMKTFMPKQFPQLLNSPAMQKIYDNINEKCMKVQISHKTINSGDYVWIARQDTNTHVLAIGDDKSKVVDHVINKYTSVG